jgi:hypothetical protein
VPRSERSLPPFLEGVISSDVYSHWLSRKASAHARRDQKRFSNNWTSGGGYRDAIHKAVLASEGRDYYTGEPLDWTLLSTYNNESSKAGKHAYKAQFALLPTVDHERADDPKTEFRICAWRTNDAKHDLSLEQFVDLCKLIVARHASDTQKNA